jgi:hypothetical protein
VRISKVIRILKVIRMVRVADPNQEKNEVLRPEEENVESNQT